MELFHTTKFQKLIFLVHLNAIAIAEVESFQINTPMQRTYNKRKVGRIGVFGNSNPAILTPPCYLPSRIVGKYSQSGNELK